MAQSIMRPRLDVFITDQNRRDEPPLPAAVDGRELRTSDKRSRMPDATLTNCIRGLSAVFIFGGDIKPADDPNYLGGLDIDLCVTLSGTRQGRCRAMSAYWRARPFTR